MNRGKVSFIAWLAALAPGISAAAGPACQVAPFQGATLPGGAVATMQVQAGSTCTIVSYGVPGEHGNPAESGKVTHPPAHGKAMFVAPEVRYTPSPGYVGSDEFEYEAFARSASNRQVRLKVLVKVHVTAP